MSATLLFPLIVKPPQEDASLGITSKSVVRDVRELLGTMDALQREFQSPVLIEEFIDGREFYVGVLGDAIPVALPVMELDFSAFPPTGRKWRAGRRSGAKAAAEARVRRGRSSPVRDRSFPPTSSAELVGAHAVSGRRVL